MKDILKGLTKDHAVIRLDEHDRSCLWCAKHEERCLRGQLLVIESLVDGLSQRAASPVKSQEYHA